MGKITKKWCASHRNKAETERKKCHKLIHGKGSKVPKRKYKKRKIK